MLGVIGLDDSAKDEFVADKAVETVIVKERTELAAVLDSKRAE